MENLKTSFGRLKVNQIQKTKMVQNVFTKVASKYDLMNDLMSFGTHRLWKKRLIQLINVQEEDNIIDVGSGTGDILKLLDRNFKNISITAVDLNTSMLNYGKERLKNSTKNIDWINCNAEKLPLKDNSYDKYIISFCLRNITFIEKVFSEALRILKPGGTFYCLEFSTPQSSVVNNLYNIYKKNVIPFIGKHIAKNEEAYIYLEKSISQFPQQEILLTMLEEIGFVNSSFINIFNGIVSIHKGFKI